MSRSSRKRRRSSGQPTVRKDRIGSVDLRLLLGKAVALHRSGDLAKAKAIYDDILARQPDHAETLQYQGILANQVGQSKRAARLLQKAISANPKEAAYRLNLGKILEDTGDERAAIAAYQECIQVEPKDADAHFNLGTVLLKLGQLDGAARSLRRALTLRPEDPDCLYNLAHTLKRQGKRQEAVDVYQQALKHRPEWVDARNNLANILFELERPGEAVRVYREAEKLRPGDVRLKVNLGNALREEGEAEAALACYREAVRLDPAFLEAHLNLGKTLNAQGWHEEAAHAFRSVLALKPAHSGARKGLAASLRLASPKRYDATWDQALCLCLASPDVYAQDMAHVTAEMLKHKYDIHGHQEAREQAAAIDVIRFGTDPLLKMYLASVLNADAALEIFLTTLRRRLLADCFDHSEAARSCEELMAAVALQCFSNEYVFAVSQEEERRIRRVRERLQDSDNANTEGIRQDVLLFAMYAPLSEATHLPALKTPAVSRWGAPLSEVVERTLSEPLAESSLAAGIQSLGDIEDATSHAVREQYEENPYPRWLAVPREEPVDVHAFLARRFPHFHPPEFLRGPVRVLVAGCGTGQEPIAIAQRFENGDVVALDLSRRSLAYGVRMARKLGVHNLRFLQGDILDVKRLDQQFHVIQCVGVLHHMADPMQGWQTLAHRLVPGGVMKIGLYSELARAAVISARERIKALGLGSSPTDIKAFRHEILQNDGSADLAELTRSEDFYNLSACRDLLFHVNEHRFTVPQIREALADLGLTFIGFELPTAQTRALYLQEYPADPGLRDFSAWDRFEERHPRSFAGMYRFWCQKPLVVL